MKFHNNIVALIVVLLSSVLITAKSDKSKTAVVSCGAETVECTAVVNAIGDPIEIDVSKYKVDDLGTITQEKQEKKVTVTLPVEPGSQTVYSLTPSIGESKDKKIFIVFDNIKHRPGTRLFGKTQVKIYRRFADEKATQWIEAGKIEVHEKQLPYPETPITVKPDGTAVWVNPKTNEPTVFQIGKKDL